MFTIKLIKIPLVIPMNTDNTVFIGYSNNKEFKNKDIIENT